MSPQDLKALLDILEEILIELKRMNQREETKVQNITGTNLEE